MEAEMVMMVLHVSVMDAIYESIGIFQACAMSGSSTSYIDTPNYPSWDTALALLTCSAAGPYGLGDEMSTSLPMTLITLTT